MYLTKENIQKIKEGMQTHASLIVKSLYDEEILNDPDYKDAKLPASDFINGKLTDVKRIGYGNNIIGNCLQPYLFSLEMWANGAEKFAVDKKLSQLKINAFTGTDATPLRNSIKIDLYKKFESLIDAEVEMKRQALLEKFSQKKDSPRQR